MSAKRRRYDTRTILIVLFIIVIIAAGYIFITNLPAEEEWLTPEEIMRNKNVYLGGGTIIVRGFYEITNEGPAVVSTTSTVTGRTVLRLDYSGVTNAIDILIESIKYDFTGYIIEDENPFIDAVILVVEKIEEV